MKIIHNASKFILPVAFAGLFGIASVAYPSLAIANDELEAKEMKENKAEMDARKEIKQEAGELKQKSTEVKNDAAAQNCQEMKDKKHKKDKKDKSSKHFSDKAQKHARELAVKHNMTNRPALPEQERISLKHGNILDSKMPHEKVSEPLKSELQNNPEYEWVEEDEWFIVGQDLVLVHKKNNEIHKVMRGVFR